MAVLSPSLKLARRKFFVGPWRGHYMQALLCGLQVSLEFICITCLIAVNVACPARFWVRRLFVTYWKSLEASVPRGSCSQVLHLSPEMAGKTLLLAPVFHGCSSKHDRLFGSHLLKWLLLCMQQWTWDQFPVFLRGNSPVSCHNRWKLMGRN